MMSARVVLAVLVGVGLAAGSAWADEKVQPATKVSGGGASHKSGSSASSSSSSSSSSRGESARSSSDRATSSRSSSARSSSRRSSDSRATRSPQSDAQRRHPRPVTGTGRFDNDGRRGSRYAWGSPYYGYGYGYGYGSRYGRYGYYYDPYDSWYSPYYYSGYYGYSPSYYRRGRGYGSYRDSGSLRIIVDPEKTRVYVDGYYAGIVDDFDGILQRLNVPPGRHDITLKLEGYRTQHFKVYVPVDDTIKIHYDMVRGSGEATSEQFAGPPDADYARVRDMSDEDRRRGDDDGYGRDDDYDRRRDDDGDSGSVRLSVSPRDASVYVDGEFRGSGRQANTLRLRPGRHRIEVVRPGFRTVEREIEVERGRSTTVEFELERM
jgi:hypothetical protein